METIRSILNKSQKDTSSENEKVMADYVTMLMASARKEVRFEVMNELEQATARAATAESERDSAKSSHQVAESSVNELKARIAQLQTELETAWSCIDSHVQARIDAEDKYITAEQGRKSSEALVVTLRADLKRVQTELAKPVPVPVVHTAPKPKELKLEFVRDHNGAMKSPITVKLL